jgi:hypothetical protein
MKLLLSIYTYGGIPRHLFEASIREFAEAPEDIEWQFFWPNEDALITRSRSAAAQSAMNSDCDVWVQIDHDIGWNPGDIAGLARKCMETKGVVAGLYTLKRPDQLQFPWRPIGQGAMSIGRDELLPASVLPTGFMAVHIPTLREAVEKLKADPDEQLKLHHCTTDGVNGWWDVFRVVVLPNLKGTSFADYQSEDWAFCTRMAHCGVPIHAWTKPMLVHYGSFPYCWETLKGKIPEANKVKPPEAA